MKHAQHHLTLGLKKKNSASLNLWTSKTYSTWKSRWMPTVQSRHSESPLYYTGWRYQDDIDGASSYDYAETSHRVKTTLQSNRWYKIEHGSGGTQLPHSFRAFGIQTGSPCPWEVVLYHSLSESYHHTLSNRTVKHGTLPNNNTDFSLW